MINQSPYKDLLGMDPSSLAGMFPGMMGPDMAINNISPEALDKKSDNTENNSPDNGDTKEACIGKYEDLFDEIYPMHGTFPVHKDLIPKLIQESQSIVDGNAQEYAKPVNVFGNEVTLYKFDYAGFLCQ